MKTKQIFLLLTSIVVLFASGCTRIASKTGPLTPYPEITSDIQIGEEVRGEGTRAELLGFIRWGDPGRATFRSHMQEHQAGGIRGVADALGGGVVKQSMQSAVYKALDGEPDNFIVDPHFHVVEHNFLVFRTATTKVVGRKAKHTNYRQVKRFNSDNTETLPLARPYAANSDVDVTAVQSLEQLERNFQALQTKLDALNSSTESAQAASWRK
tara:strand:+ start:204 stop:839 length:636 start_codon:yes stop_codon:yes gene_type:complete